MNLKILSVNIRTKTKIRISAYILIIDIINVNIVPKL